ncbi:BTAD domain-containing putative transcriptional regulator [Mycobacterium colombiense]|nr:BTAD domain-containing putative transcriptional regulator [Mycobacterium colombiense]
MELGVLGPLQVRQGGASVVIPGAKPRAILTMLGLHCGSVVAADTLVELLWGQDPPRTAAKALQTHISSLRRSLGDGFVLTQGAGWVLAESEIDASRYKSAARLGRDAAAAGDTSQALARFEEALALWRGIPELPDGRRGTSEKTRWVEGHAALVEDRADALLATGRAAEVIGDLEAAVAEAPLRERRWGQLMLALYRAGRQGEALGAYQRARSLLADDLGVDPGPELRRLEAAIVAQDASLDVVVAQQAPSVTRAVTFLLTDIEGSTAAWEADADAMAVALARHDELVEQVVTSRGGRLIKTRGEGDATFSVFDRPSAGAAAAIELQDAITHEPWASRNPIRVRMALHTGEVELRDGDYFGRAVNRVARLRSLAEGGQILCSGATAELVIDSLADDVMLTDLGMRQLKNLARPEHVFELRLETGAEQPEAQAPEAPMERPNFPAVLVGPGPFVGRGRELEGLLSAWQTALAGGVPTVLIAGEPGVGKTRLAGEWSQQAYAQGAVVLYGRCDEDLGAPYQPFAEALRSLAPCVGADRLRGLRGVEALLALVPGLADVLPDLTSPAHADPDTERYALFDAVVALLETASRSAPMVLILDDLHWAAKPTLLLLRHLLRFGDHARVQIVGTYRSTDLDRSHPLAAMLADLHRDGTASRLTLSGLDEEDVTAYVAEAGYDDEELAHALASVTGGNPFFLIEALRHVDESGGVWDQSTLPQGVREAVSRRLSRLPAETNKALAAAAVVGSRFDLELVEQVVGGDLIDAFDEARQAGIVIEEPGGYYRFNHAIVRQSLLAELASVRRMRLHQRIAATLETLPGADDELLAELAHHYFECAWAGNAAKAVFYCRRAADQAMARLAYEGAADLYHQALHALEEIDDELADRDEQTAELLIARCEALLAAGDVASAAGAVSQLQVATVDSARLAAWATCFDGQLSMLVHPERLDEVEAALGAAATKLAELDDAAGEATAHTVRAACLNRLGRIGDCEVALDDALTAARRAREHRRVNAVLAGAPLAALWGPNPVPRAGGRCLDVVRLLRITTDSPAVEATSTRCQAVLEAFRGRAAAARRMIDSARRTVTELGLRHALLEVEQFAGIVELIVNDPAAAEPHLRKAYNGFRRMGLDADTAETAALLGRGCLALDRDDEARELCAESERLAGHALKASIAWRTLRAHLLARGNDHDGARRIAAEAVALAERTDALVDHGDACLTLATVLGAAGDVAGARAAAKQAVDLYERKGAVALAEMARRILGERVSPPEPGPLEAPSVELTNACVRAVRRLEAAFDREAWQEVEQLYAPDVFVESRRKVVGFNPVNLPASEWAREAERYHAMSAVRHRNVVVAVRGERLALTRLEIGIADVSPGSPQEEVLQLFGLDTEDRIALRMSFDVEDMDAAIAELDAAYSRFGMEQPAARQLGNAATRAYERLHAHFKARDWGAISELLTDDYCGDDRRSVVGSGFRRGPDAAIEDYRSAADIDVTDASSETVATRGGRLALTRARYARSTVESETFRVDFLQIVELDADDRIAAMAAFDLDDFKAAITELDARYLAGEAAPHARTWSAVAESYAALNRHEPPLTSPDCVNVDHRRETAFGPGDVTAYIHAGWDSKQDINVYVEQVHRLNHIGTAITYAAHEVSQEGMTAEWRGIALFAVENGWINRTEVFDETDIDSATERFDQLNPPGPRLENAAARVFEHVWSHFVARDWDAMAETVADDYVGIDHRRIVSAETQHGRNEVIRDLQAAAGVGFAISMVSAMAIRGDRLVLARTRATGRDPDVAQNDALNVVAIDADDRIASVVSYDLENIGDAIAELNAQYATGEAADHAQAWSAITRAYDALNRREMPPTTPDWVSIDHRRASSFPPGGLPALLAEWQLASDVSSSIEAVHRLDSLGAVVSSVSHETSQEGFKAEWRSIAVITVDRDLVDRLEVFEEADLNAAIARFDELQPRRPRLENTASQVADRFLACFTAHDWGAMAEIFADDFCSEDRRRVVGAGIRHSRDVEIASIRAGAELGGTNTTSTVIATRGSRLILTRTRHWGQDPSPEAFRVDVLAVVEINADNRIAARVIFDPDDFDAAIAELDARYLAGEATTSSHSWSVITRGYAAFNRHQFSAPDWSNVDHRRARAFAPGELTAYMHATWDLAPNVSVYVEAVHRLGNLGAVVTHVVRGTSREGFDAEWREVILLTIEGDTFDRCEVFDDADSDAAIARFEQLSRSAPPLENTATQVYERLYSYVAAGDWHAVAQISAENVSVDDRRRVVNAGLLYGRDANIKDAQATVDVGFTMTMVDVVAIRGARLALTRVRVSGHDPDAIQNDALSIVETDAEDRIAAVVVLDNDDFDAAIAELDARYLTGEAAVYADAWSAVSGVHATFNRHELPPEEWVTIDHRRGTPFAASDMTPAIHTLFDLTPDFHVHIDTVHRLSNFGAVITNKAHGSSRDGVGVEWRMVMLLIVDGDRLTRCEVFDEADSDAAIVRFEELRPQAPRIENRASRTVEQFLAHFAAHDWDAMANLIDVDFRSDDRRRGINAGIRHGRDVEMANWRATAEVWKSDVRAAVVATRGEHLVLFRFTFASQDSLPASFQAAALSVVQVNDDNRCAAVVVFDPDDHDAAFEELETRYLAGEAAAHAHTWSTLVRNFGAFNEHKLPLTTPDWVNLDHRRGRAFSPGELVPYIHATWQLTPQAKIHVVAVHRLSNLGAVVSQSTHGTSPDGFDAEWLEVCLVTVDGDLINRIEVFDEADLDAALVRFEELQPQPRRLENAASQVVERFWVCLTTRNWAGMTDTMAGDFSSHDHRKVVNAGVLRGRDANIANMLAVAEVGFEGLTSTVIATRGQRLVLTRIRSSAHGFNAGEISADMLGMLEIDADNRFTAGAIFDADDIDAAFAELETRYLAGEAAAHEHTWSLMQRTYAALNRHEIPTTAPDFINVDHRRGITFEPGEIVPYVQATWDLAPDLKMFIETVHRLTDTGCVITHTACGSSQEGFDAEWRETVFFTFQGDLIKRCEMFDETDLDAALARFDEVHHPARSPENAASRAERQLFAHSAARDWAAVAETLAANSYVDDHRRVVNVGVWDGRDVVIANMRALEEGLAHVTLTVTATRGERLALIRIRSFSPDPQHGEFVVEMLGIAEIDSDGRIAAHVFFDVDDVDAAFEELETRYLSGEAAAYVHTWSVVSGVAARFNRQELPATTRDPVYIDHRPLVSIEGADLAASIRAVWDITSDSSVYIEAVHQLSERGAVFTEVLKMTSQEGFDAEVWMIMLFAVEGDRINRCEVFDEAHLDAAIARFDELHMQAKQLENAANRVDGRLVAYFNARNWDAMGEMLANDWYSDDRRALVNVGLRRGRDVAIANMRASAELGIMFAVSRPIATRGERLVLSSSRWSGLDQRPEAFHTEILSILEVDADDRVAAHVLFDLDDIGIAFEELESRYLSGQAAAHAHVWSVITRECAAFNRHELPAADWVTVDHRRLVTIDASDLLPNIRATWDLMPDIRVYIESVHRVSSLGAVVTYTATGTAQEGFVAEWRMIHLLTVEGDRINRSELFDEADLDAALERFDELQPQTRRIENAASRVIRLFWSYFADRRWDSMAGILADNSLVDDRRRTVNAGLWRGRDAVIANMRALSEVGLDITLTVVATRGERLALYRESTRDVGHKEFGVELLTIVDINADEKITAHIAFDVDDVDAAFEELDARYLAGEAADHAHVWSLVTGRYAALNRHEVPSVAAESVVIDDHRRIPMVEPGDATALLRAAWDLTPHFNIYIEEVHRLSALGAVVTRATNATSQEGFIAEWRAIDCWTVEGDRINRCEIFDEADLDAALARFDELDQPAPRLENAATAALARAFDAYNRRDLEDFLATLDADGRSEDRRKGLRANHDGAARRANVRAMLDTPPASWRVELEPIAIRDSRFALARLRWRDIDEPDQPVTVELLGVVEVDDDGLIHHTVSCDPEDINGAFAALTERWIASGDVAHPEVVELIQRLIELNNNHDWDAFSRLTAGATHANHRQLGRQDTQTIADHMPSIRALVSLAPDCRVEPTELLALSARGAVGLGIIKGTTTDGAAIEIPLIQLILVEGDRVTHIEDFDPDQRNLALARFEALAGKDQPK